MQTVSLRIVQVLCLLLGTSANAQSLKDDIERALQTELSQSGIPSLQVAVGKDDKIIFDGAVGFADMENGVAASPDTKYRSSSISKWLTATATLALVEQGRLDLDEAIQEYCPEFPDKRWPVTSRHLLTHTSGIRHYVDYERELSEATTDAERIDIERRKNRDALSMYTRYTDVIAPLENFKNDPLVFEPGTSWLYSSFGYRVLGCVLEGASGRSYRSLLEEEITSAAGMISTVPDDAWAIIPDRAAGYHLDRGNPLRRADMRDVSENLPAGGHLTTASDLIAFAQAFHALELVSAQSVSLMTRSLSKGLGDTESYTSWRHVVPSREKYGYGIMLFPNENRLWIGHSGRQAGSSSMVVLVPDENLSIAVLTNVKGWDGYLTLVREIQSVVQRYL